MRACMLGKASLLMVTIPFVTLHLSSQQAQQPALAAKVTVKRGCSLGSTDNMLRGAWPLHGHCMVW